MIHSHTLLPTGQKEANPNVNKPHAKFESVHGEIVAMQLEQHEATLQPPFLQLISGVHVQSSKHSYLLSPTAVVSLFCNLTGSASKSSSDKDAYTESAGKLLQIP